MKGTGLPITTTRTYDAANQLVSLLERQFRTTTKNIAFTFDNNGNRTRQYDSISSQPTNYVYDGRILSLDTVGEIMAMSDTPGQRQSERSRRNEYAAT